jgi:hypothetical protein
MQQTNNLMLRVAVPIRSTSHGIEIAKSLNRMYNVVSSVVSVAASGENSTVLDYSEIRRIDLEDEDK